MTTLPDVLALMLAGSQLLALTTDWQIQTPVTSDAALYPIPPSYADQALQKVAESSRQIEYLVRQMERNQERHVTQSQELLTALIKARTAQSPRIATDATEKWHNLYAQNLEKLSRQHEQQLESLQKIHREITRQRSKFQ